MSQYDYSVDPRDPEYRRTRPIYRPKIHIGRAIFKMFFPIVLIIIGTIVASKLGWIQKLAQLVGFGIHPVLLCVCIIAVYVAARMRSIIIWFVRLYQHYAPEDVRRMCQFIPTCSDYMILAVEKYGAIRGFLKGINRLSRCTGDAGGIDEP